MADVTKLHAEPVTEKVALEAMGRTVQSALYLKRDAADATNASLLSKDACEVLGGTTVYQRGLWDALRASRELPAAFGRALRATIAAASTWHARRDAVRGAEVHQQQLLHADDGGSDYCGLGGGHDDHCGGQHTPPPPQRLPAARSAAEVAMERRIAARPQEMAASLSTERSLKALLRTAHCDVEGCDSGAAVVCLGCLSQSGFSYRCGRHDAEVHEYRICADRRCLMVVPPRSTGQGEASVIGTATATGHGSDFGSAGSRAGAAEQEPVLMRLHIGAALPAGHDGAVSKEDLRPICECGMWRSGWQRCYHWGSHVHAC